MAFQQGLSGLEAAGHQLDVLGNNVANAGTIGFKGSRAEFGDLYMTSLYATGLTQAGIGVETLTISPSTSQGDITQTDRNLDLAIAQNGFFVMRTNVIPGSPSGSGGSQAYTRNGQFQVDSSGFIVNDGDRLQGWMATNGNIVQGQVTDLQILTGTMGPATTTTVTMPVTLNSGEPFPISTWAALPLVSPAQPASPTTPPPQGTYNWSNAFNAFDSLGNAHPVTLYYQKATDTATGAPTGTASSWQVTAYIDGALASGPTSAPPGINTYALNFDSNGVLLNPAPFTITSPALTNGAVTPWSFTLSYAASNQVASTYSTNSLINNGYAPGTLQSLAVDKDGVIQTTYSNGQSLSLGQVVLASFVNQQGLEPLGGNRLAATSASGPVFINAPGSGPAGHIQSGALEDSNVDMTAELVGMILAQRWFQANAKSIEAQNQILQTVMAIR